jgi:hypothetical protein
MIMLLNINRWIDFTRARSPAPHKKFIDRPNRDQGEV